MKESSSLSQTPDISPAESRFAGIARWEMPVLLAVLIVGGFLRLYRIDLSYYNLHVERDLYRALQLLTLDRIPLLGSEMQYGGRVFGPLIYFLYAIPLAVSRSPIAIGIFIALVNLALLFWTWSFARKWFGPIVAAVAIVLYAFFPLEIVQLRYLWNPCFLPLMIVGMYVCLFRFLMGGSQWNVLGVVLFFSFGFQLHFSVLMTIPALLLGMVFARRWPGAKVIAASLLLIIILFSPMIVHELRGDLRQGSTNIAEVVEAEVARPSLLERHSFNTNAWLNLRHIVTSSWHEEGYRLGFTYLYFLRTHMQRYHPGVYTIANPAMIALNVIHFALWALGIWAIIAAILRYRRLRRANDPGLEAEWRDLLPQVLLLLWQFSPLLFLSLFNYHRMGEHQNGIIPVRYYLISFPAQFLIAGCGVRFLCQRGHFATRAAIGVVALLAVAYTAIGGAHLFLMARKATSLPYLYYNAPTLGRMLEIRDVLLKDFQITVDDYYERTTSQNVLGPWFGEATVDLLITQNPLAYRNPGLPENTQVIVWAPIYHTPEDLAPLPPEAFVLQLPLDEAGNPRKVLREQVLGDIRILLVEGTPSGAAPFDPKEKRNHYYKEERMKYLGPEPLD